MNVIVVDHNNFPGECEFPPLAAVKCGWSQYGEVPTNELTEQCWRADIIVSLKKPFSSELLKKLSKLKLIVAPGDSTQHIDVVAAKSGGIKVCYTPNIDLSDPEKSQQICDEVVKIIDTFMRS